MTTYADATDKTVDTWKQGARAMSERMDFLVTMPSLDFVEPVERYFDYLQKAVELNRELATRWAELVTQLSGTVRDEALKAGHAFEERVEGAVDRAGDLAHQGQELADKAADQAGRVFDDVEGTVEEATDKATGAAREMTDKAADTAEDLADDAAETTSKAAPRARRR